MASIGNNANAAITGVPISPRAPKKSTGSAVRPLFTISRLVTTRIPHNAPSPNDILFFGEATPIISVGRNNSHGFKSPVVSVNEIPIDAIKPTLNPKAIDEASLLFILPSVSSGSIGLIPS